MPPPLHLPPLVRQRAEANEAGAAWLVSLPDVLGRVAERWSLEIGSPYAGGTAGLVLACERLDEDGYATPCVLKLPLLLDMHEADAVGHAVTAHRLADGRGCAELLDVDEETPALLMEQLGPNLHDVEPSLSLHDVLGSIASTFATFWRPVGPDTGLMTGAGKARWLASYIESSWESLGQPLRRATIDQALEFCEARAAAHDPATAVLCHGDAHGWNTLIAGDGSCKFVDPEGLVAEPAADLAVPMREYNEPLLDAKTAAETARLVHARAERLGVLCGVDPEAILQWGHMERVSTGLANLKDFGADDAAPFFDVAERCAAALLR